MSEFRGHLMSQFDVACLGLSRKLFSLERFAKFIKVRAQLTSEYCRALEKLSQKTPSHLYFEESGVTEMWNQIIHMEAETARIHNNLSQALQKDVYEQLITIKDAMERVRKNIVAEGQSSWKEYQDTLVALKRDKDTYHKACRELELAEYLKKQDESAQASAKALAQRDKKISKCQAEVSESEAVYKEAIKTATATQHKYYEETLPRMLDSLQVAYSTRVQKLQDCLKIYTEEMTSVVSNMSPLTVDAGAVCREFQPQKEVEEYISKTESFFRKPADPVFEPFCRSPEGQAPQAFSVQQKFASRFHMRKGDKSSSSSSQEGSSGSIAPATSASTGLLGMSPEEMMEMQKTRYPTLKVPYILVYLADCIVKYGGPTTHGIFRISGSLHNIEIAKGRFNKGEYVPPRDVHDSSALFKFVLRSFPESLVPSSLYEEAVSESTSVHDVFNKLPEPGRTVAGFVVRYLREYYLPQESVSVTQMGADNIATVFFPCFMKNPSNDLQEVMKRMDQEKNWLKKSLISLDVSGFPSLTECIAASAPAQITVLNSKMAGMKPNEESAAAQRAKALPSKPPQSSSPRTPDSPTQKHPPPSLPNMPHPNVLPQGITLVSSPSHPATSPSPLCTETKPIETDVQPKTTTTTVSDTTSSSESPLNPITFPPNCFPAGFLSSLEPSDGAKHEDVVIPVASSGSGPAPLNPPPALISLDSTPPPMAPVVSMPSDQTPAAILPSQTVSVSISGNDAVIPGSTPFSSGENAILMASEDEQ